MTSQKSTYRRVLRRETHSARSGLAITLAVILTIMCAWAITEIILAVVNHRALLIAPVDAGTAVAKLGSYPGWTLICGGIIVAVVGLILVTAALSGGRRARHILPSDRAAVVVDDEVIASALARQASYAGNIAPDNVTVTIGRRTAVVRLQASSGQAVDTHAVTDAVTDHLQRYDTRPAIRTRVRVRTRAEVGA